MNTSYLSYLSFSRADYVGYLVRVDIPGTLRYLDSCGEAEMVAALRRKLQSPPAHDTGNAFLDCVLDAYQDYFRHCFSAALDAPADESPLLKAAEREARAALESALRGVLELPAAGLDELEEAIGERLTADGLHFLGGTTGSYLGPYIWRETDRTDYTVELPLGSETLTVFWMDGFLMRSWLDWLSDGEVGAGGWAKDEGIYCVRSSYADQIDTPQFTVSFLKHEAQHHADFRWGELSPSDLEYRAKLVELIYLGEPDFLRSLLLSADLSERDNSHAYAAAAIVNGLAASLEAQGGVDGLVRLQSLVGDEAEWAEGRERIQCAARALFDAHTARLEQAGDGLVEII
ncbi:hypothetical protein KQH50_00415 [bacterium]|nr:hypothetical protein [bacterium]